MPLPTSSTVYATVYFCMFAPRRRLLALHRLCMRRILCGEVCRYLAVVGSLAMVFVALLLLFRLCCRRALVLSGSLQKPHLVEHKIGHCRVSAGANLPLVPTYKTYNQHRVLSPEWKLAHA